ncbi:RNHCP domain-containing protein [Candidatus Kaiserbacteria bacterium]|nr:RNHCP domain-containing protein [Candidatus Kaiserbacteria bacterium]
MTFIKVLEDFTCERCGTAVKGSGYSNHCPRCLWSKHVDVEPGDRAASCGALMEPVQIEGSSPHYDIIHRCTRCGVRRRNAASPEDDQQTLAAVAEGRYVRDNS